MTPNYNLPPGCTDKDIDRAAEWDKEPPGITDEEHFGKHFVVIKKRTAREITLYAKRIHELNKLDEEMMRRGIVAGRIPLLDLTPIAHRFAPSRKLTAMEEYERMEREVWHEDAIRGIGNALVILGVAVAGIWIVEKLIGIL